MTVDTDAKPEAQLFKIEKPEFKEGRGKAVQKLATTDRAFVAIQRIKSGGETNLHSHTIVDGFWIVLKGRVRFYTTNDEVLAELGPMEGVVIPRNFPYWFESASDEELEILQMEASIEPLQSLTGAGTGRVDLSPRLPHQLRQTMITPS